MFLLGKVVLLYIFFYLEKVTWKNFNEFSLKFFPPGYLYIFLPTKFVMKCKLCETKTKDKLCKKCWDFLHWRYPKENPEDVIDRYKEVEK